ncbi:MAG: ATP-binding cassette domain-containing protein [Rickettsiales bacterium]|nr:ATP-binding cassette domain-containing protein [Rickettsiales bacterium]
MNQNLFPIVIKNLSYAFSKRKVLNNINLTIPPGQFVCMTGASGSGKTTLLTLIGALRTLQEGSIEVLGNELFDAPLEKLQNIRKNLGFIFQAHNLHSSLTAAQNVIMGLSVHNDINKKDYNEAVRHSLSILGLGDFLNSLPKNLSGGQKQRVAIARAIVANPKIILADEPTAALDHENSLIVVNTLKNLGKQRNTIILMVTHDNRILKSADKIITLEDGKLLKAT